MNITSTNLLIDPEWLANHLSDPNLIIIDCRFSLADPELGNKRLLLNKIITAKVQRFVFSMHGRHSSKKTNITRALSYFSSLTSLHSFPNSIVKCSSK